MKTNWPALRHGCLILVSIAVAASPALAQTKEPSGTTTTGAVISSVAITQAPQRSAVRVEGEGRLSVRAARMQDPERLVLDFAGARLAVQKTVIPGVSAPVRGVRIGQYRPDVARVVIVLTAATPYQLSRDAGAVVIYFDAQPAEPAAAPANATTLTSENKLSRPEFRYTDALPRRSVPHTSRNSQISAPRFTLPSELTQPSVVLASFSGRREPARPDGSANQASQKAVQQATTAATTLATTASQSQSSTASAAPQVAAARYTGEPISVNLKDVDLKDFFRLIHEISGLNVVLDPAVHGNLTIVLDDVPWDQALDIVLKNNDLSRQLEGNVLRIATVDTLKKEAENRRAQIEAEALAVDKVTITRFLSYAHSKDVVPTLKKFLTQRGDIVSDDRTNALIIEDIPAVLPQVDRLIQQMDRKTQEVEIEARVVAATRSFARDIGVQLGLGWGNGTTALGGVQGVGTSPIIVGPQVGNPLYPIVGTPGASQVPLFSNLGATGPTSGLQFINATNNMRIDLILTMAESRGLLKILSRPRIVTQNNIQAVVKQGVKVPIVTQAQLGGPPTVTYVDAFLRLTVTPQITSEGTIFLNVDVENTIPDFGNAKNGNPTLITQQATTQVLITDGGTVVIGGVIQTNNSMSVDQVPLLGDIPYLGNLFKHRSIKTSDQELIFFITPRIIQT